MKKTTLACVFLILVQTVLAEGNCSLGCRGEHCDEFDFFGDPALSIVCMREPLQFPIKMRQVYVDQLLHFKKVHNQRLPFSVRDPLYDTCSCNDTRVYNEDLGEERTQLAELMLEPYHVMINYKELEMTAWRNSYYFGLSIIIAIFATFVHTY